MTAVSKMTAPARSARMLWGEPAPSASSGRVSRESRRLGVENIAQWLSSRGLLDSGRIERIDLLSGRAFAALVQVDDGRAMFIKQPLEAIPPIGALREGSLL